MKSCPEEKSKTTACWGWGGGVEKHSMTIRGMVVLEIRKSKIYNTEEGGKVLERQLMDFFFF